MAWRLAYSLVKLRAEVNGLYPDRSTISDGTIGDAAHQSQGSASDHNPWLIGRDGSPVVSALDITTRTDADPGDALAEIVRMDPRTKYVIRNRRIANGRGPWLTYYGDDPHDTHMHVSVSTDPALYDDSADWLAGKPIGGAIGNGGLDPAGGGTQLEDDDMFNDEDRRSMQSVENQLAMIFNAWGPELRDPLGRLGFAAQEAQPFRLYRDADEKSPTYGGIYLVAPGIDWHTPNMGYVQLLQMYRLAGVVIDVHGDGTGNVMNFIRGVYAGLTAQASNKDVLDALAKLDLSGVKLPGGDKALTAAEIADAVRAELGQALGDGK